MSRVCPRCNILAVKDTTFRLQISLPAKPPRTTPPLPPALQYPPCTHTAAATPDAPYSGFFAAQNSKSPKIPTPAPTPVSVTCWTTSKLSRSGRRGAARRLQRGRRLPGRWPSIFIQTRCTDLQLCSRMSFSRETPPLPVGSIQSHVRH